MSVVVFDPAQFKLDYPQFASVSDAQLQYNFDIATLYCNNTDSSVVTNVEQRAKLLDLLTAHITTLQVRASSGSGSAVGRLASASEGGVSTTFDYAPSTQSNAWYNQTGYGAAYWAATVAFRSFKWQAPALISAGARRGV